MTKWKSYVRRFDLITEVRQNALKYYCLTITALREKRDACVIQISEASIGSRYKQLHPARTDEHDSEQYKSIKPPENQRVDL